MPLSSDYLHADPTYLNAQRLRAHVGNPLEVASPWDGSIWTVTKLALGVTLMAGAWVAVIAIACATLGILMGAI